MATRVSVPGISSVSSLFAVGMLLASMGGNTCSWSFPRGARSEDARELLPFLELLSLAGGGEVGQSPVGFEGQRGAGAFLLLLAHHYSGLLKELCLRDFRLYYQPQEGELRGASGAGCTSPDTAATPCAGRPTCFLAVGRNSHPTTGTTEFCWEPSDAWSDPREALTPKAAALIRSQFRPTESHFSEVQELTITTSDLHKARLWRMSPHYRRAFSWARIILQGLDRPIGGGQAPPLALDANDAFERFAEAVTVKASAQAGGQNLVVHSQAGQTFLLGPLGQQRIPDVLIRGVHGSVAVGDAKYKEVLEGIPTEQLGDLEGAIIPRISSADWNQLYVYMRLTGAPRFLPGPLLAS